MKQITIVGGGLAGLALGILLRRENVPVVLYEAGKYPRHRVCGEFISGRALSDFDFVLRRAIEAKTATFSIARKSPLKIPLPETALCLSRYELDHRLAQEFQKLGGDLCVDKRFTGALAAEAVVRATGRRRGDPAKGRLFGLKAHAVNASLAADLELHFGPRHYVGLCRIPGGRVNVCGLFFSQQPLQREWPELLANSVLSDALKEAKFDEDSFCAVAGLTLDREPPNGEFCIGDAAAMIPPLTGNGMSMAFESAALAVPTLSSYARGEAAWAQALEDYRRVWRKKFSGRLRWAALLQGALFNVRAQRLLFLAGRFSPLTNLLFARTR